VVQLISDVMVRQIVERAEATMRAAVAIAEDVARLERDLPHPFTPLRFYAAGVELTTDWCGHPCAGQVCGQAPGYAAHAQYRGDEAGRVLQVARWAADATQIIEESICERLHGDCSGADDAARVAVRRLHAARLLADPGPAGAGSAHEG
jgi:hypothetical protein